MSKATSESNYKITNTITMTLVMLSLHYIVLKLCDMISTISTIMISILACVCGALIHGSFSLCSTAT